MLSKLKSDFAPEWFALVALAALNLFWGRAIAALNLVMLVSIPFFGGIIWWT